MQEYSTITADSPATIPGWTDSRGALPGTVARALLLVVLAVAAAGCAVSPGVPVSPVQDGKPPPVKTSILVSDDSPAFMQVAEAIRVQSPAPIRIRSLGGDPDKAAGVVRAIRNEETQTVVAIGLHAAQVARQTPGKKIIFCQVFNYEPADLLSPNVRGVSAIPPVMKMFAAWKALDPKLVNVGMVTGPGMTQLTSEARQAAQAHGINLTVASARSDKEMVYVFRKMSPKIQGYWLVPDHRILSNDAIRELMSHGMKRGKQLMVFTPELLQHGGIISVESDYQDIAAQVTGLLKEAGRAGAFGGPAVRPLTRLKVQVNPMIAKELGLRVPEGYAKSR